MPTKRQIENADKVVQLAIEWERLRSPMRYLVANGCGDEITEAQWAEFNEVECGLAEAVGVITGRPTVPPEGWRSTFSVIDGGKAKKDETCPRCGKLFEAQIHFIRCDAEPCPMKSTKDTRTLLQRFVDGD